MASLIVLYWRDIPSQVIVKAGPLGGQARVVRALHPRDRRGGDACRREERGRLSRRLAARRARPLRRRPRKRKLRPPRGWRAEYDTHRLALLAKHDGREGPLAYVARHFPGARRRQRQVSDPKSLTT